MSLFHKLSTRPTLSRLALAALVATTTTSAMAGPKAVTWVVRSNAFTLDAAGNAIANPTVAGNPDWVLVGSDNDSDPRNGDTAKTQKRLILCFLPGNAPQPASYPSPYAARPFYTGWSGGQIGLSAQLYQGAGLTLAQANGICQKTLKDTKARVAEFHDNGTGGWNLGASIHTNSAHKGQLKNFKHFYSHAGVVQKPKSRFWMWVNDQNANFFN